MSAQPSPTSAQPAPAGARPRRRARIPAHPPRTILDTIMTLAVIVLERRIRKALRSSG
jgi:hypothetical protein